MTESQTKQSGHISAAAARPPGFRAIATALLRDVRFVVAIFILAVSAVGLNATAAFLQLHFRKEAVPLPVKSLADPSEGIPTTLGHWEQISIDEPLDHTVEEALGTHQYINRLYVDNRIIPSSELVEIRKLPTKQEREKRLAEVIGPVAQADRQDAGGTPRIPILTVGISYYTGLVDTVAHIPERCYVADGFEPAAAEKLVAAGAGRQGSDVPFRFIGFEDQTGHGRVGRDVGYFFIVNGAYTENPLEVRRELQNLFQRYGYYAKVEMMAETSDPGGATKPAYQQAVQHAMMDLIHDGISGIEKCLPNWEQVTAAKH